ncbi:Rft protein [Onchocerca flexuosa]|uniref:Protein RFT1 homolog n=1 Tax=Onchocerca flexuosa TaxID=387005 RepID=A0A238BWT7_9BILA|nr:Rft protein [Onchocerca flexuosa]
MDSLASSFIHNFSGQLLSRLISFGINMYLLRRIDSDALGLVNVNLTLFYSTTIFLVREPFRKVFLANDIPQSIVITHLWFAPIICPLIAALLYLCFWLPFSTVPDTLLVPSYIAALSMFAFSAWLESFAEPYVILLLRFGMDAQYAFAQGFLVITQRIFVLVLVIMIPMLPVYAFCCAQTRSLLGTFIVHSIFKQAITNAVFDAVDKLGSLVARIIFAPLEHSAYLYFSSCLRRTTSAKDQTEIDVKKGISAMNSLLHIVTVVGTVIFIFAISYSPLAIKIYGGSLLINNADKYILWNIHFFSSANILRLYCFYIIIIAINGIAECFAMATMDEEELLSHGWFLFLSSPIQIFLSSAFSYAIGAYGLILANIISMLMRIAYSWRHIRQFSCGQISFLKALPNFSTIVLLLFCLMITSLSLLIFGGVDGIMHSAAHAVAGTEKKVAAMKIIACLDSTTCYN